MHTLGQRHVRKLGTLAEVKVTVVFAQPASKLRLGNSTSHKHMKACDDELEPVKGVIATI